MCHVNGAAIRSLPQSEHHVALQLVVRGLCAGLDEDAPCYAVLLSVHDRESGAAPAPPPPKPDGASLPAKAKHSNRCVAA